MAVGMQFFFFFFFFMGGRGIGSLCLRFSPGASTIRCTIHPPGCFGTLGRCTFVPGASLREGSFFFYVT
uniref:Putative secreted protein n=1 Tax=Ixodes scapularis TaxID=6945 RepID=A0A4D5RXS7_IXOSC